MKDIASTAEIAAWLRNRGFSVAVDHFGSGYASFHYLRELPVAAVKIDRRFIGGASVRRNDAAIIRSLLAIAKNLEIAVSAQGIESEAQLDFLKRHGCRSGQGFHLSPPLDMMTALKLVGESLVQ